MNPVPIDVAAFKVLEELASKFFYGGDVMLLRYLLLMLDPIFGCVHS